MEQVKAKTFREIIEDMAKVNTPQDVSYIFAEISYSYQHGGKNGNGKINWKDEERLVALANKLSSLIGY